MSDLKRFVAPLEDDEAPDETAELIAERRMVLDEILSEIDATASALRAIVEGHGTEYDVSTLRGQIAGSGDLFGHQTGMSADWDLLTRHRSTPAAS